MKISNLRKVISPFPKLKYVFFDFDGVFTRNEVYVDQNGNETAKCCRADGIGLTKLNSTDIGFSILSTETNPIVMHRAAKLGVDVDYNIADKREFAVELCASKSINLEEVAFVGNDENDLGLFSAVGVSFCPPDSWPAIVQSADFVTDRKGGDGCVREVCDFLFEIERLR